MCEAVADFDKEEPPQEGGGGGEDGRGGRRRTTLLLLHMQYTFHYDGNRVAQNVENGQMKFLTLHFSCNERTGTRTPFVPFLEQRLNHVSI